ncbi:glutamate--tRNA ligase [bacterium]|nr:MAG: glutamate--tRNA ligase [bacterium]QQR61650.1 MAG: glutamate--tRNA ligase [bacterium]
MKNSTQVRVRFAPAPTGMMHLGNVRAAVINYLFARQKKGVFIVRIEDTDVERNYDPGALNIIADLQWLKLLHDEGPGVGGAYGPYFQSERMNIYQKFLDILCQKELCYRCFCSVELLEKKRMRMQAAGLAPRYDRACLQLSSHEVQQKLSEQTPFIWRFKLDHSQKVTVNDLAHGIKTFELHNFSDFPLTRSDGSFTFIFANFVDDMEMKITHIFRGEDHLTNSACQAPLFDAFNVARPLYLHMPILCNIDGKKLSKRDFGFSLRDLKDAGFLPEAIVNYLAIIGGSFAQEIMSVDQLIQAFAFDHIHTTGHIKYNVEKLRWINRRWLHAMEPALFISLAKPFLIKAYPSATAGDQQKVDMLLKAVQNDIQTLCDIVPMLAFYFDFKPALPADVDTFLNEGERNQLKEALVAALPNIATQEVFMNALKTALNKIIEPKRWLSVMRLMLTGTAQGIAVGQLIEMLGSDAQLRLKEGLRLL